MNKKKQQQVLVFGIVGLLAVTAAWWFMLYSPRKTSLAEAKTALEKERQTETQLKQTLQRRQDLVKQEPKLQARQALLDTWVPDKPNLPQFINDATSIAKESGIDFVSISPSEPTSGGAGQGVIGLNLEIKGGFFQLLDYLNRIAQLPRTVVVDKLDISPSVKDGEVSLAVNLDGRMFMTAVPEFTTLPPGVDAPAAPAAAGGPAPVPAAQRP